MVGSISVTCFFYGGDLVIGFAVGLGEDWTGGRELEWVGGRSANRFGRVSGGGCLITGPVVFAIVYCYFIAATRFRGEAPRDRSVDSVGSSA